ncbi:MAG: HAMP domain-containing histidine kinase [Lachnospiraceae bacterium]|nr:HAMP domain-containing histidine kinase [Lachnospiraceae bacterium]
MKIMKRLWLSILMMIVAPIILATVIVLVITDNQIKHFEEIYGATEGDYSILMNSYQAQNNLTADEFKNIKNLARGGGEELLNLKTCKKINKRLEKQQSALVIRSSNVIVFDGTSGSCWGLKLPEYGSGFSNQSAGIISNGKSQFIVKQYDFKTDEGQKCSAFIVTAAVGVLPETQNIVITVVLGLVALVITTGFGITFMMHTGIITPIQKLERATKKISQGDLDFTIEPVRDDEIGKLCEDFEQMRKRLKESAEAKVEQDRQYKILISNICHDLKTPITSIQGYVEGIMDGVANTPEKQDKYLKTIYIKAKEMNNLINELTIYSKLDTNRVPYDFKKLSIKEYFDDCVEDVTMEMETRGVELRYYNFCDEATLVIADPEQLTRVLHNIVSNAVKYMDKPRKQITLRVKDVGDFVQIEIEDTGKGISSKDLPFIFDRFYRADSSRNQTKGSGIGLSIVKKIVEDHGGKIWATSKLNIGTTMYFVLRKCQEVPNEQNSNH